MFSDRNFSLFYSGASQVHHHLQPLPYQKREILYMPFDSNLALKLPSVSEPVCPAAGAGGCWGAVQAKWFYSPAAFQQMIFTVLWILASQLSVLNQCKNLHFTPFKCLNDHHTRIVSGKHLGCYPQLWKTLLNYHPTGVTIFVTTLNFISRFFDSSTRISQQGSSNSSELLCIREPVRCISSFAGSSAGTHIQIRRQIHSYKYMKAELSKVQQC